MKLMSMHHHQMFPFEFLEHLVGHFNRLIKSKVIKLQRNKFIIQFDRSEGTGDKAVVISLFTKLVTAFKSISDKYLPEMDQHTQIKINLEDTDTHYTIVISGIVYIPSGKFLNLFSLILWYHIRYITGTKPANTEDGTKLNDRWKEEEKRLRFEINQSRKSPSVERDIGPCHICGEPTYKINKWEFKPNRNTRGIEMKTRVCQKHVQKLI